MKKLNKNPLCEIIIFEKTDFLFLTFAVSLSFLNDFLLAELSANQWIIADLSIRCVQIALLLCSPACRICLRKALEIRPKVWIGFLIVPPVAIACVWLNHFILGLIPRHWPFEPFLSYPVPDSTALIYFDLTIGLLLVAVSEELIYRSAAYQASRNYFNKFSSIILVSAIFALAHYGTGLGNTLSAFAFGVIVQILFIYRKSIWSAIFIHYFVNLLLFFPRYSSQIM